MISSYTKFVTASVQMFFKATDIANICCCVFGDIVFLNMLIKQLFD